MEKGLFMDLDHTLIKPISDGKFAKDVNDWMFIPGVLDKIKRFNELGYIVMIVSNQGGIELGYSTVEDTELKFANIIDAAKAKDVVINDHIFTASNDDTDPNRKPNPGMAELMVNKFDIDLSKSIMVGDMESDREFAKNAGIAEYYYIDEFLELKI